MNTDKVLALAREAGAIVVDGITDTSVIQKFAALIQQQMEAEGWIPPEIRSEKWSANDKG